MKSEVNVAIAYSKRSLFHNKVIRANLIKKLDCNSLAVSNDTFIRPDRGFGPISNRKSGIEFFEYMWMFMVPSFWLLI